MIETPMAEKIVHITRRERFSSAHRIYRPDWSDEENLAVFGLCSNPHWHGHNYVLWVTVKGPVDLATGFVANLKDLSRIIKEQVVSKLDHRNINVEVDFMQGKLATTENLATAIWEQLEEPIKKLGILLHCIKIEETENNFAEYFGS